MPWVILTFLHALKGISSAHGSQCTVRHGRRCVKYSSATGSQKINKTRKKNTQQIIMISTFNVFPIVQMLV